VLAVRDPEARAPYEPAAFSVDHVLPAATHPEHKYDRDNLRAAHYGCNRARANGPAALTRYLTRWYTACGVTTTPGARITAGQTPVTSRDW
jgi:hypothetical protein